MITNADGEIPPTAALPCATELAYVIDGPLDPVTNLPKFQQVQDTFTVAKTSAPEVEVIISLVPVPAVRIPHLLSYLLYFEKAFFFSLYTKILKPVMMAQLLILIGKFTSLR